MSSKPGQKKASWRRLDGWLLKDIIHIYRKQGHKSDVARYVWKHIPREVCASIIGKDANENSYNQRGDKGTRLGYEFEHPDKHPLGLRMMPYAKDIVENNRILTHEDVARIVQQATSDDTPIPINEAPVIPEGGSEDWRYFYLLGMKGSTNCGLGTSKDLQSAMRRIRTHSKGDVDGVMFIFYIMQCNKGLMLEDYLKKKYGHDRISTDYGGSIERFRIAPQHMLQAANNFCDVERLWCRRVDWEKEAAQPPTCTSTLPVL
jgi:hypothetical protein